jgi:hypothetical protein
MLERSNMIRTVDGNKMKIYKVETRNEITTIKKD